MSLTEFLLARVAEDEEVARACFSRLQTEQGRWLEHFNGGMQVRDDAGNLVVQHSWPNEIAHIARHDPSRVLAECVAKRAIVGIHETRDSYAREGGAEYGMEILVDRVCVIDDDTFPCETVRALALPYADHPDFDPDW